MQVSTLRSQFERSPGPLSARAGSDSPSLGDQEGLDLVPARVGILVAELHDPPEIIGMEQEQAQDVVGPGFLGTEPAGHEPEAAR